MAKDEKLINTSFEAGLQRLKTIVDALENKDLTLDEGLAHFEEGMKLNQSLQEMLDSAAAKFELLSKGEDGKTRSKSLKINDSDLAQAIENEAEDS
ncbi:MAG: exodeoxyribonuclease VII small subunit [Deltaproteobacteria bacterium]|jgi:exodeoxyribonuclease VII small subunit|nr:exodeoxyribonuclease VII small subunit [Deltaproteobacteria bacterium]